MLLRSRRLFFVLVALASLSALVWQSGRTQSPLRRVTNTSEAGTSINPSMSGDGRIVAFESTEDIAGAGGFESFHAIRANVSVDPPTFLQIGASRAPAPAVSQDGSRIAFASKDNPLGTNLDANSEIFLYDGAKLIQVTNTSPGDIANRVVNGNFLPSISDDGRYVAFSSNRDLAGQNADGNLEILIFDTVALGFTQLTNSSGIVGFSYAKISGNGAFVAYIRDAGTTPSAKRDLLLQSRVGVLPLRILATDVQSLAMTHGRAISDDGTRLVWAAETATNTTQVFLFDGRNNTTRQITSLGFRATDVPLHATISGDGARIAFATRRSFLGNSDGSVDLYSFDIPSATFGRATSGPSTATAEVVSSLNDDGTLIAFNFPRVLSGVSQSDFANSSEIYVTGTPSRPAFGTLTVLNGASFGNEPSTTEAVAPDSIAVARGSVLANTTEGSQPSANGTFPLTVGGTTVTVNGRRAQILFVSPTQVNFLVPPETEFGTAEVIVTNADGFPSRGTITTLRAAPGIFTFSGNGLGDAVILDAGTLLPAPFDPTGGNLRLAIFSTGVRNSSQVSVSAGGLALTLESIVPSPTMPGLDEVHVLVPADLSGAGKVALIIRADGRDSNPVTVNFVGDAKRDIVINEFLADPPDGAAGDANKDGLRNTSDDEFVELVNTTDHDIDISGYQLLTHGTGGTDTLRHTFAAGTILPACTAIVVFGGGNPSLDNPAFGGAQIIKASSGSLTLINSAGVVTLRDQAATIINFVSYGGSTGVVGDANQSVTRSPDTTGAFTLHQSAGGPGGSLFSPGTRINGTAFTPCPPIARIEVSPLSATVEAGALQQFTARAFDAGGNELSGVIFSWQSSNTAAATIDQNGRATTLSAGVTLIRASGRSVQSALATLTVNPPPPVLTSVTISPVSATIRVGEVQQFTAQAKDQFGQNIGGVTISFSSNNTAVATVDAVGATSTTGSATATITGHASGSSQITATANNGSIKVTSSAALLTVEPGAGQILISEFRTRGPNGASDEFIELYNPTLSTITIAGLKIRASNSAGGVSDRITIPAGTTLPSGRHYLVANNTASTGYGGAVTANQTYTTGIADDGAIAITGSNATSIIDSVGMSSGSVYKEGTPLAPLTNNANQSYERRPGGPSGNGTDTNNNLSDFFLNAGSSSPQNLDSAGLNLNTADLGVTKTDSPDPVITGSDLTYTITVTNNGPGIAQSVVVTDNLPASVTFISCSSTAGGTCGGAGNNRTISFQSLASGSSAAITLVATANGAGGTNIANTAIATSATSDPDSSNNLATATSRVQAIPLILNINDVTAIEGKSGTTTFTFTLSSSAPAPAGGITFDIATQDDTAISNVDYLSRSLTGQTIPAGQQTYAFDVTVNSDVLVEPNETFLVNVSNVSSATIADGRGQGTIQNDDTANLVISQVYAGGGNSGALYTNDFIEIFNRGTTTVNFAATPYSLQYAGATANFGSNKVELTSGTIGPGKYFLVQLSSGGAIGAALPAADASGSINLAATAGKIALVLGTTGLNATSCPLGATVNDLVGYGTTADCFEGSNHAPTPSATAADFRKSAGCTDTDDNAADFLVGIPSPRNTSVATNDCSAPPAPTLTINDVSANEGNSGTTTFTFMVTLSAPAPAGGISFDIASQDNTATVANGDYVARTLTSQMIVAGNLAYTFEVTVNGDVNIEANETFFVNVTNVSGATVVDGQAQGTIENDDTAPALSVNDVSANETSNGTTTFTFTVSSSAPAPAGGIRFDIATADATAQDHNPVSEDNDYVARLLTDQTIPVGQQTYTFDVTVNGDLLAEPNETFFVNITNASSATIADGQGQGTIQNDDTANLVISQIYAGGGNSGALYTNDFIEILNHGTTTVNFAATPYSLQYAGATANFGSNKANLTSGAIGPGKYFLVQLSSGGAIGGALPAADAIGSLNLAATAGKVSLVAGTTSLPVSTCPGDDNAAPFNPNNPNIADFIGYGSSAICYEGPTGPAPAPSATTAEFRKAGGCTDTNDNATDFLLAAPSPRNTSEPTNDCSAPPPPPTLTINDVSGFEGDGGALTFTFSFRVALSAPAPAGGVSFDIATQDNTATAADGDYVPQTLRSQTIPAGNLACTFDVTINGDLKVESNESFFVNVTKISGATIGDNQGLGTIQNDDIPTLTINDVSANETNSGTTTFTFTVTSSLPAPAGGITFDIATADGTAQDDNPPTEDNDYVAKSLTAQTITAGNTSYAFQVKVSGDTLVEANETLFVNLSNVSGATIADGQGQGTIQNDDSANLVISQVYAGGGNSGAQYTNDFVEIFNRGTTTIDFATTPYSIQYAGATANFGSNKANLTSGTIAPGRYFLVQLSSGGAIGATLPAADASSSLNLAATAGKVSLVVGTTSLPVSTCPGDDGAAPFNPNNPNLADFVGYGSSAICYEGPTGPAPAPSATTADFRKAGGCTDANDNAADFFVHAPGPRNTGSPSNNCTPGTPPSLSINDVTAAEGNNGSTIFTLTVSLSAPAPSTDVTFDIATQDNTATAADGDYVARTLKSQTIPAGFLAYTFDVTVNGDVKVESNEAFFVNVTNVSGATIADGQGRGTIQNDDTAPPVLSINDVSANETNTGTTTFSFTITSSLPAPAGGITFDIATVDATAQDHNPITEDNDYIARLLTGQTIPAGQQTYTFDVAVNGDLLVEPNETFVINLSNASGATIADGQGQATIQNDDTANLVISQVYAGGGNSGAQFTNDFVEIFNRGTTTVNFAATPYSLQYAGATANFGSNKANLTSGTIGPGKYFLVQLSSGGAIGAALPAADASGSINLAATAGKVSLVVGTASLTVSTCPGDDGAEPFTPNHAGIADFVGYGSSASCYEGPTGSAPAPSATTAEFRKAGGCKDTNDNASDFFVHAPGPRNSSSPMNNCTAGTPPNLSINDVTAAEGNNGSTIFTFTVSLSAPAPSTDVTFDIATQNNTATTTNNDYVARSLTSQIIPAGQQTYTFAVTINGDTAIEPVETFLVSVTNVLGATVTDGFGVGTIHNDDLPTLSINDVSLSEGNVGTRLFTFTVSLSAPAPAAVTFDIATQENTATVANNDFVARSLTGPTIAAGSQNYNFEVTVNGDFNMESDETFFVNVTNVSGAIVGDAQGLGTIQNDDIPALSINDATVSEGDSGTTTASFTVTSSLPAPAGGITFNIATQDGTATSASGDYVAKSLTSQTIPAGQTTYAFNVTVNGDTLVEPNETFLAKISAVSGAPVADDTGQGTIQNDDTPAIVISQIYGGGGNSGAVFKNDFIEVFNRGNTTVNLAGWSVQYSSATGSSWSVTPLCATSTCLLLPGRYFLVQEDQGSGGTTNLPTPDASGTILLTAGAGKVALVSSTTALTGTCPSGASILDLVGYGGTASCFEGSAAAPAPSNTVADVRKGGGCVDSNDNAADFFTHAASPRNNAHPVNNCSGQTADLTINDVTVTEGDTSTVTATFTVTLHGSAGSTVTVDYSTSNGTAVAPADYQTIPTTQLVFTPGELTKTIAVNVNGDTLDEPGETFFVNLSNATNAGILDNQGQGTITDNDVPPTLTINDVSQNEGSGPTTFTFTVHLSAPALTGGVTFDIATADGTAQDDTPASEDNDYVGQALTGVNIPAGSQDYTFSVTVNGDMVNEPNETFFVNVTNVSGATVGDGQGLGTIQNDDSPALSIDDLAQAEGNAGSTVFNFIVTSSLPAPMGGITFEINTADGTAQDHNPASEDNDYVPQVASVYTIPEGETFVAVPISVNGDRLVEPNETFTVNISNISGASAGDSQGVGTIQNDDTPNLVITQIYPGGGNAGATYTNDFIEIFNRGTTTVDFAVTPYSVQYVGASATFGSTSAANKTNIITGTIAPGQYFLIQGASGGSNGVALPTVNAAGSIAMAATGGKVALVLGTGALPASSCPGDDSAPPTNPSGNNIVDFIGYGTGGNTPNCFEGSGSAAFSTSTAGGLDPDARSVVRSTSCTDTNNNSADFTNPTTAPTARNKATTSAPCP